MDSLIISNRTVETPSRVKIEGIDLSGLVDLLKEKIADVIDIPRGELELIYRGQCLKDGTCINSYGIVANVVIYVLRKRLALDDIKVNTDVSASSLSEVISLLTNPAHRNTLEQILSKAETMEALMSASLDLYDDQVAMAILQTPEMLLMLAESNKIEKLISDHPCLAPIAVMIAGYISNAPKASTTSSGHGSYSLDQMSDDEDDVHQPAGSRQQTEAITTSQLAAALMATSPSASSASPSVHTPLPQALYASNIAQASTASGAITNDFFREAIQQASASEPTTAVTEASLQQMRDMGIEDESMARRALTATNGDIQAALELIFGDGTF